MTYESAQNPTSPSAQNPEQIREALQSYARFDRWMDQELEKLVERWIHTAAPNALRVSLGRRNSGR